MRSEWKDILLRDILQPGGYIRGPFGSALKRGELLKNGIPVYEQQNAIYDHRKFRFFIDKEKFNEMKRFAIQPNDIIISCSGTIGKTTLIKNDDEVGIISQALLILRVDKSKIIPRYLQYFLESAVGYNSIISRSSGSVQVNIAKKSVIEEIPLLLPPLSEQKAIAAVLSALDDKIELNNRINQKLEEMAQAIFKSWFVDFEPFQDGEFVESELGPIPKGWRTGILSDIADITMGQSPSGNSYNENAEGTVFYQGRAEFGWRFPTRRLYTTEPKRMAQAEDVLLSVRAPVGDINVAWESCCIGRGLAAIHGKENISSFVLYLMFGLKKQLTQFNGEGTVFGSINKDSLNTMQVILPQKEVISQFEKMASSLDMQIKNNFEQNCRLQNLRDTLLPKLMSGELRVPCDTE